MQIARIEFISFNYVRGPRSRPMTMYLAKDWPGWTAKAEGSAVLLEGEGRRIELPRNHCVIEWDMAGTPAEAPRRGPGRPPKQPVEPQAA